MNIIQALKGISGLSDYKNQQSVGLGWDQKTPGHSELVGVYRQATGIIYSAKYILNPSPTAPTLVTGSTFNPLEANVELSLGTDGVFALELANLPADMDISESKVHIKAFVQHADLLTDNIRITGYIASSNNTTKTIGVTLETFLLSDINTLAHPTAAVEVYVEVCHN